jgi:flavin-dependent dehydrogenase
MTEIERSRESFCSVARPFSTEKSMGLIYDAIVVGARCAGASTAMLLARKGLRVLLLDKSTFPAEIPHGHFIHRHGPRQLQKWGLLERIVATGCPPSTTFTVDTGEFRLTGRDLVLDGVAFGYGPRRGALDWVLVEAAMEAGAEFRAGCAVEDYLIEENRVVGIRAADRTQGLSFEERAAIVVGADGRGSRLARTVGAAEYEVVPTLTCWFFCYWSDIPATGLEIYVRQKRAIFAFPTNGGLFAVFVAWPIGEQSVVQSDVERHFLAALDLAPELAARVRAGRRAERFLGAANLPNFLRKPYGSGWALVGDAGCHKDPYLALGICDALRDAEWLALAIHEGLSGNRPLESALSEYEHRRNNATMPHYRLNLDRAQFKPPAQDELRLQRALIDDQEATNRFFMAYEEMIPPESFFNPDNLRAIMERGEKGLSSIERSSDRHPGILLTPISPIGPSRANSDVCSCAAVGGTADINVPDRGVGRALSEGPRVPTPGNPGPEP